MLIALIPTLAITAALGSGLIAGLLFAFSVAVMPALVRVTPDQGIAVMNAINVVILNPIFLLAFMGTALLCAAAAVIGFLNWGKPGAVWLMLGGIAYLLGTILVTMAINVPMNDALAAGTLPWATYLGSWTAWNHVRMIAALAAMASFALAFRQA